MTLWYCPKCDWSGESPSITDASVEVELTPGQVGIDRVHRAVCPECFGYVSRWSARDEADARGDWEFHRRQDDRGPP